jgi:hypothetical protein
MSESKVVNGKVALSQKKTTPFIGGSDDIFGNQLSVAPELKQTLEKMGLVHRWVDYKRMVENGGAHEYGWRPIKRSECGTLDSVPNFGGDVEGYFRRGSLVLAVRSVELNERHKAYLKQQARTTSQIQKTHAEELREMAKRSGINMSISEGYGEEE